MKNFFRILFFSLITLTSCTDDNLISIDYSEFDAILSEANSIADVSKEGNKNGDIIIGSTEILNTVIEKYTPYRETAINQGTINIATERLKSAVETYRLSIVIVDGTTLESTIANAQSLHDNAEEGAFPGEYQAGSKAILQAALDEAKTVSNNTNATQAEIDTALSNLLASINEFNDAEIPPLDFDSLNTEIDQAQSLHDNAVEGTNIGEYASGSKAVFLTAINDARDVVNATTPLTQGEIDAALTALQNATVAFEAGKVGGPTRDTTALENAISDAQALHDNAIEGSNLAEYPSGSKAILQQAINDAQTVVNDISLGQPEVDTALANLQAAVTTFENSVNAISVVNFAGDTYIETPSFQGITGGTNRTMEAWINTTANSNNQTLILSWGVNSAQEKWDMRINQGKLRIEYSGGGINGTQIINDGVWHHVAIVVSNNGANLDETLLYVDGSLDAISGGSGANPINSSATNNFNIGRSASQTDRFFIGSISDVRIWNVARSESEIASNKDTRLTGNEAGLVGYWKLNDGSGTVASDSSTSNHTGNIIGTNFTWDKLFTGLPFSN